MNPKKDKIKSLQVILVTDKILIIRTMCNMSNKNPEEDIGVQTEDLKKKSS